MMGVQARASHVYVWLLLATWVAYMPLARAAEEDNPPRRAHLANVLRAGHRSSSRALLQQQGATLELVSETISAGYDHTCALATNDLAFCWGNNLEGQLGDGTFTDKSMPVLVSGGLTWTQISAGHGHTCGVDSNGSAFCWGRNGNGQLGDGTTEARSTPTLVEGDMAWTRISAGNRHTCALAKIGSAFCWGLNLDGQLGDGTAVEKSTPTRVISGSLTWTQISAGYGATCALANSGLAFCWGRNIGGQLGDGTLENKFTPTPVAGDRVWKQISAGGPHTCGLSTNGSALCWGENKYGGLGDGTTQVKLTPTPVAGGTAAWSQIKAGEWDTCALAINGMAFCWGLNFNGKLGDGTNEDKSTPTQVDSATWTHISAGGTQTCAIAINGSAFCWGSNESGQLGDGTNVSQPTPTLVKNGASPSPLPVPPSPVPSPSPSQSAPPPLPPSIPLSPPPPPSSESSVSPAVIAGGVAGGICVLAAAAIGLAVAMKKRKRARLPPGDGQLANPTSTSSPPATPKAPMDLCLLPSMRAADDAVLDWVASHAAQGDSLLMQHSSPSQSQCTEHTGVLPAHLGEFEFAWKDFRMLKPAGRGAFGKVYIGELNQTPVALKVLLDAKAVEEASSGPIRHDISNVAMVENKAFLDEVKIMASLRHPNICLLIGFCKQPPSLAMEYCTRGSVFDVLKKGACDSGKNAELTWGRRLRMAVDAAVGMLHLHTRQAPILHRDFKSPNLLVAADWTVKICDMGMSRIVGATSVTSAGGVTNPRWLAPEMIIENRASTASDVYAFGIVMWELLTWRLPFENYNQHSISYRIVQGERPPLPPLSELPGFGPELPTEALQTYIALMKRCWAQDPQERPDFAHIAAELRKLVD